MAKSLGKSRLQIVLDTSALIADPDVIHSNPGAEKIIPLTVIEELDGLKSRHDEVGWMARTTLRNLEKHRVEAGGSLSNGIKLPEGGILRVEINGVHTEILERYSLPISKADNRIIAAALSLRNSGNVLLLSNDAALRIKAAHLGLNVAEHTPLKNVNDPGPGWQMIEGSSELIDKIYTDKEIVVEELERYTENEIEPPKINTFLVVKSGSQSALLRSYGSELRLLNKASESPWGLQGRSKEQKFALELLMDPEVSVVALDGPAGTGKSLLAVAAGLEQVVERESMRYDRLSVFRSLVPVGREELGFLPGDINDKVLPHFAAFFDAVTALTERRSARDAESLVEQLRASGQLTLEPVTFLRGRSISRSFIIVDEAQNLERSVLKTLLTRVSEGTKIVFTGDVSQIDNPFGSVTNNAVTALIQGFHGERRFGHIRLTSNERSEVAALAAEKL